MDWFEQKGFRTNGNNRYHAKIANNNVSLMWQDETHLYAPCKWYCIVEGSKMLARAYADTKEEAFNETMRKFKEALEQQRDKLQKRIDEIAAKM